VIDARWISGTALVLVVASVSGARAQDMERFAMSQVRLSTDPAIATGCARMTRVSDDSVKDLRRKIVRSGGNTAVLSFAADDLSLILADVYRCQPPARRPPNVPPHPRARHHRRPRRPAPHRPRPRRGRRHLRPGVHRPRRRHLRPDSATLDAPGFWRYPSRMRRQACRRSRP